jgi:hypothetical protein
MQNNREIHAAPGDHHEQQQLNGAPQQLFLSFFYYYHILLCLYSRARRLVHFFFFSCWWLFIFFDCCVASYYIPPPTPHTRLYCNNTHETNNVQRQSFVVFWSPSWWCHSSYLSAQSLYIFIIYKPSLSICWNDTCSLKYNKNGNAQRKWLGDARSLFILKFEKKDPRNVDRIWILKK